MTTWSISTGDILEHSADGLICSANPNLNLSGGVGGAILVRFGTDMQDFLHDYLQRTGSRHIEPGNAVLCPAFGSGYVAIAHAVAIDAFYDTNAELILKAYRDAITKLSANSCRTIVAACLGCGYGRCDASEFVRVIEQLIAMDFPDIDTISLVTTNTDLVHAISGLEGVAMV